MGEQKALSIGSGFTKRLTKPWEMHVRLLDMQQGLIAIQAEIEISQKIHSTYSLGRELQLFMK